MVTVGASVGLRRDRLASRIAVSEQFDEALVAGAGLVDLISCAAEMIGGSIVLTNPAGRAIAAVGTVPDPERAESVSDAALRADVIVRGRLWGAIHAESATAGAALLEAVLERLPTTLAIALARSAHSHVADERIGEEFILDMLAGDFDSPDVGTRAELAGLPTGEGCLYVAAAARLAPNRPARVAMALRAKSICAIQAEFVYDFIVLAALPRGVGSVEFADELVTSMGLQEAREPSARVPELAVGAPSSDLGVVARSLREVRDTLALATELGGPAVIASTGSYAVDRLIHRIRHDPELARFVDDFLGSLLRHDHGHSSQLVRTLAAYLDTGMSKTEAASRLSISRASLYRRLQRIEELVGPLDNSDTRLRLEIALKAHRHLSLSARSAPREAWWMDLGR